jgi:spermidine synthase
MAAGSSAMASHLGRLYRRRDAWLALHSESARERGALCPSLGSGVKPRELIAQAQIPGGDALRLYRRDGDFMIVLGGNELMSSRMRSSEEELAERTCERLREDAPSLLIGGYGMGFTLRAALAKLGAEARVQIAELVPEVIAWARGPMASLTSGCLDDPRVEVVADDVAAVIARAQGRYDAILLDVDNGPEGLTRAGNDQLYSVSGLTAARAALQPGGRLSIWSASPDAQFGRRLHDAGFEVEEILVRGRAARGPRHMIWLAANGGNRRIKPAFSRPR